MSLLTFVPLALSVIFTACILKLAALIFRRARVSWKHSFIFSCLLFLLTAISSFVLPSLSSPVLAIVKAVLGIAMVIVVGGWYFRGRARTADGVPFSFSRASALTALMVGSGLVLSVSFFLLAGIFSTAPVVGRAAAAEPTDFSVEVVGFSPKNGSTLLVQEPIDVMLKYHFTKPREPLGIWVKILDPGVEGTYVGIAERLEPGVGTVVRSAYLVEPGKVNNLTVVVKDVNSTEIFRKDIAVDYTFKANPALDALKDDGKGSTITRVDFPEGKQAVMKRGTFVRINLGYSAVSEKGVYAVTIPVTDCSKTYAALFEPLFNSGNAELGFTIGEKCHVKQVKVVLSNVLSKQVFEKLVDVDLQYVD